jgi:hypothetical protein
MKTFARYATSTTRTAAIILVLYSAAAYVPALACSVRPPPIEVAVSDVATTGYLISGTVIQAFDATTRQPEIILADHVFVGEGMPREFKIYRTNQDFESRLKRSVFTSCQRRVLKEEGFRWERFVLIPAPKQDDGSSDGQWVLYWNEGSVSGGKGYEMFLAEAKRLGRLQERPPANKLLDY